MQERDGARLASLSNVQSAARKPAASPDAQWNSFGLESMSTMLRGSVWPLSDRK